MTALFSRWFLEPDFDHNAAFYDKVAGQYDAHMLRKPSDVLARRAFVDLVTRNVSPGSTLLDFGCGTGLDAMTYAQRGYRVLAYDHSAGMIAQLERRCPAEIASAAITACSVGYSSFIKRFPFHALPHAMVSNFAALNLIRDLEPLFDTCARHLAPPGWMIVSIWNPIHWTKLGAFSWWGRLLKNTSEVPVYKTRPYLSYLHFVPDVLRAAPQFRLIGRANAGTFVRYDDVAVGNAEPLWWDDSNSRGGPFRHFAWQTAARKMLGHFVFLVLRRDP